MRSHLAIHLNQAAQNRITIDDSVVWFSALTPAEQVAVVYHLVVFLGQTRVTPTRLEIDSLQAALNPNGSHPVRVTAGTFLHAVRLLADGFSGKPESTYRLLLTLFASQDRRRRDTQCAAGCPHWWHRLR